MLGLTQARDSILLSRRNFSLMGLLCYSNILPSERVILVDGVELGDGLAGFFQLSGDTE